MNAGRVDHQREAGSACVVGVGASAGGLDPIRTLIGALPATLPAAVVVLQHRDPSAEDHLAGLIADRSDLPVRGVKDGGRVEPGCVHVAPGRTRIEIGEDGRFRLEPDDACRNPIDHFFESLARTLGPRAIGVILSGAGHDGALGLRSIAEHGGMTMVQAPETAKWQDMPARARDLGATDHLLPPKDLAEQIAAYARYVADRLDGAAASTLHEGVRAALPAIVELLHEAVGHDFRHYKPSTLERRIARRMQVLRIGDAGAYLDRLRADPEETASLFQQLLIGVTQFFRDPDAFDALSREAFPAIFRDRPADEPVRVWVVGCATGEEAYSFAIALREYAETLECPPPIQIFATDVDERALGVARKGVYPARIEDQLSPERLARFFVKRGKRWKVTRELREMIAFSPHDVTEDPPFSRQDLISCRNVLIYLGPSLQKRLIPVFHHALAPGGYLMLGPSESITGHRELFRSVDGKQRIWQRKPTAGRGAPWRSPVPARSRHAPPQPIEPFEDPDLSAQLQRFVLDELAPKAAIVDEEGHLLCVSGDMSRFMSVSGGAFRNEITRLVRQDLRVGVRAALTESRREGAAVVRDDLTLREGDRTQAVRLTVRPMPQARSDEALFTVVFEAFDAPSARARRRGAEHGDDATAVIEQLERELEATRDELERSVQDLEATNEELKASNEELLSMNEELQSSNEELETSKEEVQAANEALGRAHDDLHNLLRAAEIAALFLDSRSQVRGFTPSTSDFYHLIDGDVGRPLHHITPKLDGMPPIPAVDSLGSEPIEERFRTAGGRCFMRRILAYRTSSGEVDGMVVTFFDVTELEAARTELARSLAHLEAVYASAPVGLGVLDRDHRFVRVNDRLAAINGLPPDEHVGRRLDEILDSDLARFKAEAAPRVLRGESIHALELSGQARAAPDGERRWVVSLTPVHEGDDVVGMSIVVRDVTEERAVELERQRLATLVERSGEFVGIAKLDGTGLYLNPAGRAMVGLDADVADTRVEDYVVPEDLALLRQTVGAAVRTGRSRAELRFHHLADDTPIPVLYDVFRIDDPVTGRPDSVGTVTKDLREMQRVEAELIESRNRLMALAHGLPNIVWRADAEGNLSWVSHRWRELTGLDDEDTLGGGAEVALHPDDLGRVRAEWARHVASGEPYIVELRLRVRNGEYCWFLARATPVRHADGTILEWIGSFTDIHSLKQLQAQLEAADHRKNEFLAMLGHELRNPLAPILSAADLLTRRDAFEHLDEARGAAAAIERQAWHLARMVDDLLDVARLSRGRVSLRRRDVDLRAQVRAAVEANEGLLQSRRHHLELRLPDGAVPCRVDPTRVTQIISNLVNNAAKYAGDGAHVSVSLTVESKKARIAVADDGPGIEPDVLPRLFEPFTQASRTLDRAEGGLGLGLSLSKGLAELHGGTLEVDSHSGGGATFVLTLPIQAGVAERTSNRPSSPGAVAPQRILVVDDNEDAAAMLSIRLQRDGHEVDIASAGPEALELAQRQAFDVMLLDIGLPGMSGYELAREIRRRAAEIGRPRLIALTGYGAPGDRLRSEEAGFEAHLLKPVDLEVLRQTIAGADLGADDDR